MSEEQNWSVENSKKLDRILQIVEGTGPNDPGLVGKVNRHEFALFGDAETEGLIAKVRTMWRAHVWLIGVASATLGSLLTWVFKK